MRRRLLVPSAVVGGLILSAVVSPPASASPGQVVNDKTSVSLEQLVATLVGPGVEVSNLSFTGDDRSVGTFAGMSALGVEEGVALSTGMVSLSLPGPNVAPNTWESFQLAGDADLDALIDGVTFDASVLEFDFVPSADSLTIKYVFGSEEYNEFVGTKYNDAFGFYINGENCAVAEGAPVTINSINGAVRPHLFVDNTGATVDTALDGFTRPLACTAATTPGAVNHAKIVIADAEDTTHDSTVIIAREGFFSNTPPSATDLSFAIQSGGTASVNFAGTDADGDPLTYALETPPAHGEVSSITNGVTYTPHQGFVGTDTFSYTVSDGMATSGPYTVTITVSAPTPVNLPPVVSDVSFTVVQGVEIAVPVVAIDPEGAQLTYETVDPVAHGAVSGIAPALKYTSAADYVGADGFSVRVTDPLGESAVGRVTIDVVARPVPVTMPEVVAHAAPGVSPGDSPGADGSTSSLATTGTSVEQTIGISVVLVILGVATIVFRRRRRTRSS